MPLLPVALLLGRDHRVVGASRVMDLEICQNGRVVAELLNIDYVGLVLEPEDLLRFRGTRRRVGSAPAKSSRNRRQPVRSGDGHRSPRRAHTRAAERDVSRAKPGHAGHSRGLLRESRPWADERTHRAALHPRVAERRRRRRRARRSTATTLDGKHAHKRSDRDSRNCRRRGSAGRRAWRGTPRCRQ